MEKILNYIDQKKIICIVFLTTAIESVSAFFRFALEMTSQNDTAFMASYTFNLRIHHGYFGVLLLLIALFFKDKQPMKNSSIIIGWSLILSDLIHHFIVLWIFTGNHDFFLTY